MDEHDLIADAYEAARERRRRILLDPPDHGDEAAGYFRAHGVRLEAVVLIRRGETFRVLTETPR